MKFLVILLFVQNVIAGLDTTWWKHTTVYEIFIWSFKDSNGDGIGDIKGITSKLNHFVDLNIGTLYLTPFYKSPMVDMGYDIANFTEIDKKFGVMEDFEELIRESKKRGLKVVIDMVVNHCSDEHPWFLKSIDRIYPYENFFIWQNPAGFDMNNFPIPPNNWMNLFGGSAWTWNEKRRQFYLHQFFSKQPDLNLRNEIVQKEMQKILKFWLEKGVAGFRIDAPRHFFEDELLRNEPLKNPKKKLESYYDLDHIYTADLPEVYDFLRDYIRTVTDEYSKQQRDFERILIAEAYTDRAHTMAYYGEKNYPIMHFPFNFELVCLHKAVNATDFQSIFEIWLKIMPEGAVANWVTDNHDNPRYGTKIDKEYGDIILITVMMAPGVACLYYGQEIGMMDGPVRPDQRQDNGLDTSGERSRDEERLPMQWDNSLNAGFSSRLKPWLPVDPGYSMVNVELEKRTKNSVYNLAKTLGVLRKTKTLKYGSFKSYIISTWVYAYTRTYKKHETYVVVINLGSEMEIIDVHNEIPGLSQNLSIVASSLNSDYEKGNTIKYFAKFPHIMLMKPQSALVLKSNYEKLPIEE